MKMVIAIVSSDDASNVQKALIKDHYQATKLATTGGFLMKGNTTFLIGAEDDKVTKAKEIIKEHSQKRTHTAPSTQALGSGLREGDLGAEVAVGGAIVFVLDVESVDKY